MDVPSPLPDALYPDTHELWTQLFLELHVHDMTEPTTGTNVSLALRYHDLVETAWHRVACVVDREVKRTCETRWVRYRWPVQERVGCWSRSDQVRALVQTSPRPLTYTPDRVRFPPNFDFFYFTPSDFGQRRLRTAWQDFAPFNSEEFGLKTAWTLPRGGLFQ